MRFNTAYRFVSVILAAAVLAGCQKDIDMFVSADASAVSADVSYEGGTKAAVRTSVPDIFTLYACSYDGTVPTGVDYIYGETMTRTGSKWVSAHKFAKVETDRTVKYFAVHPSDAAGLTLPAVDTAGAPVFRYSIPSDAANQTDIIVASHDYSGSQTDISLAFSHILAAVDFKFSAEGAFDGTIRSITVKGVDTMGLYTLEAGWSKLSASGNISQTLNMAVTESMSGQAITGLSNALMLIPQMTEPEAELEVVTYDGSSDRVLRCSLAGRRFDAGKEYTVSMDLSAAGGLTLTISSVDVEAWTEVSIEELLSKKEKNTI